MARALNTEYYRWPTSVGYTRLYFFQSKYFGRTPINRPSTALPFQIATLKNQEKEKLTITSNPIAQGRERVCYLHPFDPTRIVKISVGVETVQSQREIEFYENLGNRNMSDFQHLPRYHGTVDTNLGQGLVLDLVCDSNGNISKSLLWYIENSMPVSDIECHLAALKEYLLKNLIIFNHDMFSGNLLLQKASDESARLIIIDGLGDVVSLPWLNYFPFHVRSKINRRWKRFMNRFYNNKYVIQQQDAGN